MNKFLITALISTAMLTAANAQNREINFKHDVPFKEVLAEAKKQNKLIFFDAYTSWCGPCKVMSNTVFKTDSVADFFNQTFVNLKVDMEKGEGPQLKDKFGVSAYPTLMFIDGGGNVVHKIVGSAPVGEFMAESRKALNPNTTVTGLAMKFNKGDHSKETAMAYMKALETAYEHVKLGEVAKVYFDAQPQESLMESKNWELITRYLLDNSSTAFKYLFNRSNDLYALYGKGKVDSYFYKVFGTTTGALKKAYSTKNGIEEAEIKAKDMESLLANNPAYQNTLFSLHLVQFSSKGQWDQFCTLMDKTINQSDQLKINSQSILWPAMEMVKNAPVAYCNNALKWADYYSKNTNDLFTQILVSDLRKMANRKLGKDKEAQAFALSSESLRKEAAAKGTMTPPLMKE
ncbi:thioredoxin family protein [Solitalea lacus]|uniref:thioredoxin family protein n=1 Tax=Solitalea lacus TaxID=2911172 RepID=UPI001EDB6979|nr:DUF255 domain-containing protein [Solitalea lacus]UKJ07647.1 DUF255 domain-containing protein [Solitalea lacus]